MIYEDWPAESSEGADGDDDDDDDGDDDDDDNDDDDGEDDNNDDEAETSAPESVDGLVSLYKFASSQAHAGSKAKGKEAARTWAIDKCGAISAARVMVRAFLSFCTAVGFEPGDIFHLVRDEVVDFFLVPGEDEHDEDSVGEDGGEGEAGGVAEAGEDVEMTQDETEAVQVEEA